MAGTRNNNLEEKINIDEICKKYKREDMSARELEIVLALKRGENENFFYERSDLGRKVRRYIEQLCAFSEGVLKESDFKKEGKFCFPPQSHAILLSLFQVVFSGGTKDYTNSVHKRIETNGNLINKLEEEMDREEFNRIKNTSVFIDAQLDACLEQMITDEMKGILSYMYHVDPTIRHMYFLIIYERLFKIRRELDGWNARIKILKEKIFEAGQKENSSSRKEELFNKDDSVLKLMISYLCDVLKGKEYVYLEEDSNIPIEYAYIANLFFSSGNVPKEAERYMDFSYITKTINNNNQYKMVMYIMSWLRYIDDDVLDNDIREQLYYSIDLIAKALLVKKNSERDFSKEAYDCVEKFQKEAENVDEKKIWEILTSEKDRAEMEEDIEEFLKRISY